MKTIEDVLMSVLSQAKNEEERHKLLEFMSNPNNNDFIEQAYLISIGYEGWITLSSGKIVYIELPRVSGEDAGKALKTVCDRMKTDMHMQGDSKRNDLVSFIDEDGNFKSIKGILDECRVIWDTKN